MAGLEIIIISLVVLGIVFYFIRLFKTFLILFALISAFLFLGGFNNSYIKEFDQKYSISSSIYNLNNSLGLSGFLSSFFENFKDKGTEIGKNLTEKGVQSLCESKKEQLLEFKRSNKDTKELEKEIADVCH